MKQSELKEPVFESDTFFHAIFYRNPEYALKQIPEVPGKSVQKTSRKHPENIQKIINVISENPNISMRELMQKLSLTEGSIRHHLFTLKKKGILKRIGPDKGGYWEVVK